jgi:hypothetical protein
VLAFLASVGKKQAGESGHFPDVFQILLLAWFSPTNIVSRWLVFYPLLQHAFVDTNFEVDSLQSHSFSNFNVFA